MKFQKLNENKLKIYLSYDELPNSGTFDEFIANSDNARRSFLEILDKAYDEVGFNTRDYKIKIDAVALCNGDFVFTVTKLVKIHSPKKSATPKKVSKTENSVFIIYKFDSFDDFSNLCSFLEKAGLTDIRLLAKKVELYLYNDNYYLSIRNINNKYKYISKFYSSITEFCRFFSSKELFSSVLQEKGNLILKNNAIENYNKKFR